MKKAYLVIFTISIFLTQSFSFLYADEYALNNEIITTENTNDNNTNSETDSANINSKKDASSDTKSEQSATKNNSTDYQINKIIDSISKPDSFVTITDPDKSEPKEINDESFYIPEFLESHNQKLEENLGKPIKIGVGTNINMTDLGLCNYFLDRNISFGVAGKLKSEHYLGGIGSSFVTNNSLIKAETFHHFKFRNILEITTFDYFSFNYKEDFNFSEFYTGNMAKITPFEKDSPLKSIYTTAEWLGTKEFKTTEFMSTIGLETNFHRSDNNYILIEPYIFFDGKELSQINMGPGIDIKTSTTFPKYFAIIENVSARYAIFNTVERLVATTHLFVQDYFRSTKPLEEEPWVPCILTSSTELFYISPDFNLDMLGVIHFQQVQSGLFVDLAYNNLWNYCTGVFVRMKISFFEDKPFFAEISGGYNAAYEKTFVSIGLKTVY